MDGLIGAGIVVFLIASIVSGISSKIKAKKNRIKNLEAREQKLKEREDWILGELELREKRFHEDVKKIIETESQTYPWMAQIIADAQFNEDEKLAESLCKKERPAEKASIAVKQIAQEKKKLLELCKTYEYQINYYEAICPWLKNIKGEDPRVAWDKHNKEQNEKLLQIKEREAAIKEQVLEIEKEKNIIDRLISDSSQAYPWLAELFSDAKTALDIYKANALRNKNYPALKAADTVKQIAQEKRELQKLCKLYEYQINYYETIFPWLEEFKEEDPRVAWDEWKALQSDNDSDDYQKVKLWLSPEEYRNLPNAEKYQLALDRYKKRKKSNWQVGIEYERYIGYRYEMEDYIVKYHGAILGMEDMGRDLLAIKGDEIYVIQCKRWAKDKTIHEKHIFQLYGSMILYGMQHPDKRVKGVFITTADLSDTAKYCADYLHITIRQDMPFDRDYPMIKCNISAAGERIYHLPFDQQYDHILITLSKGEFYSHTVEDAEEHGFRRAMRWKGNTISA